MNDGNWSSQRTQPNDYKAKPKGILGLSFLPHQSYHYLYEISNHIFNYIFATSSLGMM